MKNGKPQRTSGFISKYAVVGVLVAVFVVFSIGSILKSANFLTGQNISNLLITKMGNAIMALGVLSVVIVGEFDLSIGYACGFNMMLTAILAEVGMHPAAVVLLVVLASLAIGFANGFLTVSLGINAFISTLSVGLVLSALVKAISGGELHFVVPEYAKALGQNRIGDPAIGLGYCIIAWLALALIMYIFLAHSTTGRKLYAIGGSAKIAFLAGVNVKKYKYLAYLISGICTAIAATIMLGQSGSANPTAGPSSLMPVLAIVYLSTTTIEPGRYNVIGSVVAVFLLGVVSNGLKVVAESPTWMDDAFDGLILIISMYISNFLVNRRLYQLTKKGDA